jgi:ubiquinone/menaquinone biosynthesis C-methylase UbiE
MNARPHRVCPWWIGYLLASPVRRLVQEPAKILSPLVADGMTVLEPGPGMGFFTLELARRVGPAGRVVAVDVQPQMLAALRRRARRARLDDRIELRQATHQGMGVEDLRGRVDVVLAFAVVHELPDAPRFFAEAATALTPGGRLLLAEPRGHVSPDDWAATVRMAEGAGLRVDGEPTIWRSWAAVLAKP